MKFLSSFLISENNRNSIHVSLTSFVVIFLSISLALSLVFLEYSEYDGNNINRSNYYKEQQRRRLFKRQQEKISNIPRNDHENYFYYAIQLEEPKEQLQEKEILFFERAVEISESLGYHYLGQIGELKNYHLFAHQKKTNMTTESNSQNDMSFKTIQQYDAQHLHKRLENHADDILWVQQQIPKRRLFKRNAFPEPHLSNQDKVSLKLFDPLFGQQWHLVNTQQEGNDINVTGVWKQGIHGADVTVCFLDDGLDYEHPDLIENFNAEGSYDFNAHRKLPTPTLSDDTHGTRCAGEVAAIRNDFCGVGVAWEAKVSGVRILSGDLTEADEAAAINYQFNVNKIYSCSWGPADNGEAMDRPPKIVADAFYNGIVNGRNGLGSLFVFATGNGGNYGDNCNFDGYTNSIYTITIGAISRFNEHPSYSESCSAQMAVTYSSGGGGHIVTSNWPNGGCTDNHGGTSAAAPLASGIYALVLSIRPDFTWRDFQHLTVQTAVIVQPDHEDWVTVAKGRKFNHLFGFGKLDAYALVEAAKNFTLVNNQTRYDSGVISVHQPIPEGSGGISHQFNFQKEFMDSVKMARLEHISVSVTIDYQRRGDISVHLVSPHGYVSVLATKRVHDSNKGGFRNWTFMSVKHWEEDPIGSWTIKVFDLGSPELQGTFEEYFITFWGESSIPNQNNTGTSPAPAATNSSVITAPTPSTTLNSNATLTQAITRSSTTGSPVASSVSSTQSVISAPTPSNNNVTGIISPSSSVKTLENLQPTNGIEEPKDGEGGVSGGSIFVGVALTAFACVLGVVGWRKYKSRIGGRNGSLNEYEFQVLRKGDNDPDGLLDDAFSDEDDLETGRFVNDETGRFVNANPPMTIMQPSGEPIFNIDDEGDSEDERFRF